MKKKIFTVAAIAVLLCCLFAISTMAAEPSYKDGEWIYADDGTTKLAIRDTEGNPLIWYMNGEELKYVRADQTDETLPVYVKYKIEAGGNGFDSAHTPAKCLKDIDIYDNGTQIEGALIGSQIVLINLERLDIDALNGWLFGNKRGCCTLMRGMVFPGTLKYIGQEGLTNHKIVQFWNLENTQLEWINSYETNPFITTTLTQEATNYTIRFPDTLGTIASVLNSQIKTVILSPNTTVGNANQSFRNADQLEKIFVPATFYETGFANEAVRDINSKYLVFFTGTEAQAEALQANTGSSYNSAFKNATRISYSTYLADPATYDNSTSTIYLIYDTNYCDAFYNAQHTVVDDKNCTTQDNCTRNCGFKGSDPLPNHNNAEALTYDLGFANEGMFCISCQNSGCEVKTETVLKPIFTAKGYSVNDEKTALAGGYSVDLEALSFYEEKNGELVYGIVIANAKSFDGKSFFENGKVNSKKAVMTEMDSRYSHFACSINFGTKESYSIELVICAYVISGEGVSFVQADSGNTVDSSSISGGTFKSITFDTVDAIVPIISKEY